MPLSSASPASSNWISQEEADPGDRLDVVVNSENGKARKLREKALGRMQNEDLLMILEVEFFKYSGHGFS